MRSDGSVTTPICALQFPPDESDEAQTVNLIGDFGDSVNGPTPVAIRVVGALQGNMSHRDNAAPGVAARVAISAQLVKIPAFGIKPRFGQQSPASSLVEGLVIANEHARKSPLASESFFGNPHQQHLPAVPRVLRFTHRKEHHVDRHSRVEPDRSSFLWNHGPPGDY